MGIPSCFASNSKNLLSILEQERYFNILPAATFHELVYFMSIKKVEKGQYLFKPGEPANCMYLITEGEFELSITINERHLHLLKQKAKIPRLEELSDKVAQIKMRL